MINSFVEKFLTMEAGHDLFSLKDDKGFPVWDILRYDVNLIYNPSSDLNPHKSKRTFTKIAKAVPMIISDYFKGTRADGTVLFYSVNRYSGKDGLLYDKASLNANLQLAGSLNIDNKHPLDKYKFQVIQENLPFYSKLHTRKDTLPESVIDSICKALTDAFGELKIAPGDLNLIYSKFLTESDYYFKFLSKKRTKLLFFTRDGVRKCLIDGAKRAGATTVEFQHGRFDANHLMYSYPEGIRANDLPLAPDYYLTFGDYWGKNMNLPFNTIPIGNDCYVPKPLDVKKNGSLLFISSVIHEKELAGLAIEYSVRHPEQMIVFRLHPNEYYKTAEYQKEFDNYPNIHLQKGEVSIEEAMAACKEVVLIHSTALYEALSRGRKVAIYKRLNYEDLSDCFGFPDVYLFDNPEELHDTLSKPVLPSTQVFFKPFDAERFKTLVNDILKKN